MTLAIFDLDNTLLRGDSDYLWGMYLIEKGAVDQESHQHENERFYQEYLKGQMDIMAFLRFQLAPLARIPMPELLQMRDEYLERYIKPIITKQAKDLIDTHRQRGDTLLIITATNDFVTRPIADIFAIDELIATNAELIDNRYTGAVSGKPSYQEGKVQRLNDWLEKTGNTLTGSWFYSDSHNDLPLLKIVDHPVAVNPDPQLAKYAEQAGWQVLTLAEPV
ncbi:MAG: HAD family hydrolase [Gammaproteobacteria bacterium]|nr:HAD family hydrolase [Gammaproteobacteria bacterium]